MKAHRYFLVAASAFVALSVVDFLQTYRLVAVVGGGAYEANPVAAVWLDNYGWAGLGLFKLTTVVVLLGTLAVLAQRNRRLANAIVTAGCVVLVAVGVYSARLQAEPPRDNGIISIEPPLEHPYVPIAQRHRTLPLPPAVVGADQPRAKMS